MTKEDASRIQSSQVSPFWSWTTRASRRVVPSCIPTDHYFVQAKGGNNMGSDSFAARAQGAGDRNANTTAADSGNTSNNSGGNNNAGASNGAAKK